MKTLVNQRKSYQTLRHFYPWVVIALASLFLFYKYVLQVSPSVMANELMRHFHVDGAGLGNLAATFFYTYLVTQLFVGPLLDKYSPRLLSAGAIALSAVGAILFAQSQSLLDAQLARGLVGVGAAFATVSYMKMAAIWFKPQQFAFVGGLLATAAMLGSMAGQAPMAYLVSHVGWRASLYYSGLVGLVLAFIYFVLVKNKKPVNVSDKPKAQALRLSDFVDVLKRKHNWCLMLYSGLAFSPLAVFGGLWGDPFLKAAYHLTKPEAASVTSLMFFGLAVAGPVLGKLSDWLGKRFEVMVFGLVLSFVALTSVIYLSFLPVWCVSTLLFLFGFGTGAFMLGFALGKEMNSVALAATVIALINTGDALFGAFSEPLVGKFLDTFWQGKIVNGVHVFGSHDFHVALSSLPIYLFLATVFLFSLRKYCKKD